MLFSHRISGLSREGDYLLFREEYRHSRFHLNELASIRILGADGVPVRPDTLPARNCVLLFTLRNGRRKMILCRRFTKKQYGWLLRLIGTTDRPYISLP